MPRPGGRSGQRSLPDCVQAPPLEILDSQERQKIFCGCGAPNFQLHGVALLRISRGSPREV